MEANLFIKSYKTEGNKITDLKFYGDMEIDIGEGPVEVEVLPRYIDTKPLNDNVFPFGTYFKETSSGSGYSLFWLRNDAPWSYYVVSDGPGGHTKVLLPSGKGLKLTLGTQHVTTGHSFVYIFDESKEHCVGVIHLNDYAA